MRVCVLACVRARARVYVCLRTKELNFKRSSVRPHSLGLSPATSSHCALAQPSLSAGWKSLYHQVFPQTIPSACLSCWTRWNEQAEIENRPRFVPELPVFMFHCTCTDVKEEGLGGKRRGTNHQVARRSVGQGARGQQGVHGYWQFGAACF